MHRTTALRYGFRLAVITGALAVNVALCVASAEPHAQTSMQQPVTDDKACNAAIQSAEQSLRLPAQLLGAIGLIESGRVIPKTGGIAPWPWTLNVGGTGYFYDTKEQAISAARDFQAKGEQSIDVGCMQVNLAYHPAAFASLDQAFDPASNANYAAGFLSRLYAQSGNWTMAASAYHSQTPGVSDGYVRRVVASWPLASRYVGPSALANLTPGAGFVMPPTHAEPDGDCGVGAMRRFTPRFQKVILQAAIDRARLSKDFEQSDVAEATMDCGFRVPLPVFSRRRPSRRPKAGSLQRAKLMTAH